MKLYITLMYVADLFELKGFAAERKGEREEMQDAHVVIDDFTSDVDLRAFKPGFV